MPPERVEALVEIQAICQSTGHHLVLVGAYAREVTFDRAVERAPQRATRDVDAAVHLTGWAEFEHLASAITATGRFRRVDSDGLTFIHENGTQVDLIPHGPIAGPDARLRWPNDATRTMSMEGFDAVREHAVPTNIDGVIFSVADLPDLVALKLFAYADRRNRSTKDLEDLVFILRHATDALMDRVYDELSEDDLIGHPYYDYGPLLLGIDIHDRCDPVSLDRLRSIARDAARRIPALPGMSRRDGADGAAELRRRFDAFEAGISRGNNNDVNVDTTDERA